MVTTGRWHTRVSSYPVRGNPTLCWQRSGLVLGDVLPEAFSCGNGKFLGLTICWKSKETIRALYGFSCITCHLLMVAPHCLYGSDSRHTILVVCWLRFIFYFRNEFFLHYALVIISNVIFNAYQASLTIIRRNLLRFCVCIVCVCGRPYGSLIFKKHCELTLKIFC